MSTSIGSSGEQPYTAQAAGLAGKLWDDVLLVLQVVLAALPSLFALLLCEAAATDSSATAGTADASAHTECLVTYSKHTAAAELQFA
jgi:hypothetical protein